MGGGHLSHSKPLVQTAPPWLEGLATCHVWPAERPSLIPALSGFLCFLKCPLLFVAALAGVMMGTTISAVAHVASVKSRIASLAMHSSGDWSRPGRKAH